MYPCKFCGKEVCEKRYLLDHYKTNACLKVQLQLKNNQLLNSESSKEKVKSLKESLAVNVKLLEEYKQLIDRLMKEKRDLEEWKVHYEKIFYNEFVKNKLKNPEYKDNTEITEKVINHDDNDKPNIIQMLNKLKIQKDNKV